MAVRPKDQVESAFELALKIANTFRAKIGEPQIDGIVAGVRSEPRECVLARTFNAGSYVGYKVTQQTSSMNLVEPGDGFYGFVEFDDEDTAKAFRDAVVECDPDCETLSVSQTGEEEEWKVELPTPVAQIAFDFDHNQLVNDLYLELVEATEIDEGLSEEKVYPLAKLLA